jgi:hypothetical protein
VSATSSRIFRSFRPSTFATVLKPTISSFTPTSASRYSWVTITGNNFSTVTRVKFGSYSAYTFVIVSNTEIRAQIGSRRRNALVKITITNNAGSTTSSSSIKTL